MSCKSQDPGAKRCESLSANLLSRLEATIPHQTIRIKSQSPDPVRLLTDDYVLPQH